MGNSMNSRERWRAVVERKHVDRAPCDMWATPEVFDKLCGELRCEDRWSLFDKLGIDAPYTIEPPYIGPELGENVNIWGVKSRTIDYEGGTYEETAFSPLAEARTVADIEEHRWPKADWYDYSQIDKEIEPHEHRPIRAGYVEPFMVYSFMRGLENAMMDTIESPALIECAFDHIFEFATRQFQRILEATKGGVDITVPSEDLGGQTGPLFAPDSFRMLHKERFRKYIDLAREADVLVFFHTDGAARVFLPELIEIGVQILNPIQWRCPGMEREALKRDFGERLIFHGGVDNQRVLPFGNVEDVRAEVIKCFETLGLGGGYICAPCHNIQPNTPVENTLAMYETIREISGDNRYTQSAV